MCIRDSSELALIVKTYTPKRICFCKGDAPSPCTNCSVTFNLLVSHQPATLPCLHFRLPPYHHPLIIPLLRRLLRESEAEEELTVQLASSPAERAVTRTISAIFTVKQAI